MSALLKASRNDAIIARCLQTISQLIPLTSAVFYRVNNRLKPENYILHNISDNTHQQYLENFQPLDPLLPSHFSHQNTTVAAMTPRLCDRNRHYYHEFMLPNNVRDMTEIFIRRERRIVAGISLMRDVPFSSEERQRARAVLPLVELAIRDCLQEEDDLPAILTAKEREIVGMVREGASNKLIARQLDISLSTVKRTCAIFSPRPKWSIVPNWFPEHGCRPLSVRCICNLTFASRARRGSTAFS